MSLRYYDDIVGEWIPDDDVVLVRTRAGVQHSFHIYTLVKAFTSTGKLENPYTRERLPDDVVERVTTYKQIALVCGDTIITINGATLLHEALLHILLVILGDIYLCMSCDVIIDGTSIYAHDLTAEVSTVSVASGATVELIPYTKPIYLRKLVDALSQSHDVTSVMLSTAVRRHLRCGDMIVHDRSHG